MHLPDLDSREQIERMIRSFYTQVLENEVLLPYFEGIDLEAHFPVMFGFWEQLLLGSGNYEGNPMKVHQALHTRVPLTEIAFENWLCLFLENLEAGWTGPVAESAKQRAMSIATTFRLKFIYGQEGLQPGKK